MQSVIVWRRNSITAVRTVFHGRFGIYYGALLPKLYCTSFAAMLLSKLNELYSIVPGCHYLFLFVLGSDFLAETPQQEILCSWLIQNRFDPKTF